MTVLLPAQLEANPELDRWVACPAPGKVIVLTGRVELGQGVLTDRYLAGIPEGLGRAGPAPCRRTSSARR